MILAMFATYCVIYAIVRGVPTEPKASWENVSRPYAWHCGRWASR